MTSLQSDGCQSGYLHKIRAEYYCFGKNQAPETFLSKSIPAAKSQKIFPNFGFIKTHVDKIFGIWNFLCKKTRLKILSGKKLIRAHIIFIYKSYIETVDKIVK